MAHTCDALFDALGRRRRRVILATLSRRGDRTVGELVDRIGGGRETRIELVHVHLPQLSDADLVDWNRETGVVSPGSRLDEVEPFLDALAGGDDTPPAVWH